MLQLFEKSGLLEHPPQGSSSGSGSLATSLSYIYVILGMFISSSGIEVFATIVREYLNMTQK